ncbi:MAG: hypothetical protein GX982_06540 [Tissierellia bacterium]|nr:hypothetical protein [Tissierellia bacterium]
MKKKIYEINEFANMCGYFYNAFLEKNFSSNNGYNCSHPGQEETDINEETGEEIGKCYCWSCPLGFEAEIEDFKDEEIDNNGYDEECYEEMTYIVVLDSEKYE